MKLWDARDSLELSSVDVKYDFHFFYLVHIHIFNESSLFSVMGDSLIQVIAIALWTPFCSFLRFPARTMTSDGFRQLRTFWFLIVAKDLFLRQIFFLLPLDLSVVFLQQAHEQPRSLPQTPRLCFSVDCGGYIPLLHMRSAPQILLEHIESSQIITIHFPDQRDLKGGFERSSMSCATRCVIMY